MRRWKDFKHLDIYNLHNKKMGFSKDIIIDFHKWKLIGILMSTSSLFSKKNGFLKDKILNADFEKGKITIKDMEIIQGEAFSKVKGTEVIDNTQCIVGILDDLLIDKNYKIKAILISRGIIMNFIEGKRVALTEDLKFHSKYIILNKNIEDTLISMPHSVSREHINNW